MPTVKTLSGASLVAVAMISLFLTGSPAMAEYLKARVDASKPHDFPAYPASAESRAEEGTVRLTLKINSAGRVRGIKVAQSSGYPDLDDAAVMSAITWHYLPATQNGQTFSDEMSLDIKFQLPTPPQVQNQTPTQASIKRN